MLDYTFYLDGQDARNYGIVMQSPFRFSEAVPVLDVQTVPGRNGDLIQETGSYQNRSGSADCYCLNHEVSRNISVAGRFLMGKGGYRRLEVSDDPDHYWMARVENSPEIAMRARILAPFEIGLDCKPQRFVKQGEFPISIGRESILCNEYGFPALPKIKVFGKGSGAISVGRYTVTIHQIEDGMNLDSETQNAYNDSDGNLNRNIYSEEFPVLEPGENLISFSGGVERIEIIPRWWEL